MNLTYTGQLNEMALGIALLVVGLLILAAILVMAIQIRKSNTVLEKIGLNMTDIFEIMLSNKEHGLKILRAVNHLNAMVEAEKPALNSMANTLVQLQSHLEAQAEALKKVNNNLVAMYKNTSGKAVAEEKDR